MPNLPNSSTTIWSLDLTQEYDKKEYFFSLLSGQEQQRCLDLKTSSLQDAFTIRRGRLREILTHYQPDTPPQAWEFSTNAYGRPALKQYHPMNFNISHTPTQAFCLTSPHPLCGIDVEKIAPININSTFFTHTLTPREQRLILSLPAHEHTRVFTAFWCLKEAHLKALGVGLTSPMNTLEIPLSIVHLCDCHDLHIQNDNWHYHLYFRDSSHIVATALCTSVSYPHPIEIDFY
jgi:4'-phosphopantetheinyl transferase